MRQSRPLHLATTIIAALLLASCSADADPQPKFAEPTTEATPAAEPEGPPEKDPTRSPKALIRHWNDLQNAMQLDGDTAAWRKLTPDCEGCLSFADQVDDIYENGGYIQTDGRKILSIRRDHTINYATAFLTEIESAPTEYRSSADGSLETFDGGVTIYRVYLDRKKGAWTFDNYVQVPE